MEAPWVLVISSVITLKQDQARKLPRIADATVPVMEIMVLVAGLASPKALFELPKGRKLLLYSDVVHSFVGLHLDIRTCSSYI